MDCQERSLCTLLSLTDTNIHIYTYTYIRAKYQEVYKKVSAMGERLKKEKKSGPSNDEQLQLYGYAKIAEGKDISAASKPGMFDLAGKAKYAKWKEFVDAGITQKDAEDKYVEAGEAILAKYDN
ncbi:acyl binding [Pyrenophora seminiperda CCB06]|uniref:Acyl binding n=1 Tax=Pyrenophora seminiperda CCB06 TaxID=1302712 RepID=A0A3M7MGG5_9PLEO|nr:acyl binding [Pyrenophora seminiperda CCB06]